MPSSQSDRNVLFGVLALQMEFITQASLIAALQAWTLQKSRPLGELLVELGHMSAEDQAALEPMVDRHVARHGGSAEQSLAALSSLSEVAAELRELSDVDVQHSLQHIAAPESREAGVLSGVRADADDDPQHQPTIIETQQDAARPGMRFLLLRLHDEGGLGKVWVARDRELNREVAFKEIKPKHAQDKNSRGRFVREAEITGRLEHPGIVPVYGLGHFEDGRPFYAMRFIRGHNLEVAIEQFHQTTSSADGERGLAFRKLIQRLVDVCNAIAYAHSRGVLHRDLKPSNIMLGKYGETLVVDWGLAKAKGQSFDPAPSGTPESIDLEPALATSGSQDVADTQMGNAMGSPKFMSPEQAAGRLDLLGPASDVYSLGATLYELLTGQSPIGARPGGVSEKLTRPEVLRRAKNGEFPAPRSVLPQVPAPLEAVCLKAMSRDPQARYATAQALAEDLERWLADEPVAVYREPLPVRVRRFVRRHQVAVTSLAATLFVGLVGLGLLAAVVSGKNEQLQASNDQERAARLEADNQRAKAERSEAEAQAVLTFFQDKVLAAARPENEDGGLGINVTIRQAIDAAEPLITDAFPDQPLVEASIRLTLGNTYSYLGLAELAIRQCERARKLYETHLGPEHPDTLTSMNNLANAYRDAGKLDLALPLLEQTLELRKAKLGPEHPDTLSSMGNLAAAYRDAGKHDLALPLMEQTLPLTKAKLGPEHPDTLTSMNNLALAYRDAGKLDLALPLYEQTLELRKAKLGPEHPHTLDSMNNLAAAYLDVTQPERAETYLREALAIREKRFPDHWETFQTKSLLGDALAGQKKFQEAEPLLVEGYAGMQERESQIPANEKASLTYAIGWLVKLYSAWEKPEEEAKWQKILEQALSKPESSDIPK